MENYMDNNNVEIGGEIIEEIKFSHEIYDEKFYKFLIKTKRLSEYEDILPVIISSTLIKALIKIITSLSTYGFPISLYLDFSCFVSS